MDSIIGTGSAGLLIFIFALAMAAGLVKGVVGFAMPMVMISGLSTVLPAETALGLLIIPTLVTNLWQALRQGVMAALASVWRFRVYIGVLLIMLLVAAQLVQLIPNTLMLWIIGAPVTAFALTSLLGRPLRLPANPGRGTEAITGVVAGFFGGIAGVWGPPTVAMLIALNTEKKEQMRAQGAVYGLGAVALTIAHLYSGVLNSQTLPLSLLLVIPGALGLWAGFCIQDRIDQRTFSKATLVVLFLAGLNLLRRAIMGV